MNSLFKQSCRKNKTWKVDDSRGNPTYFSFMYVRENARAHTHTHIDMLKGSAETVQVTEYFPNCFASQIFI